MPQRKSLSQSLPWIGLTVATVTLISVVAWCYLAREWSGRSLLQGLSLAAIILFFSTPGLLYRPNRAAGLGLIAAILLFLTIFGLGEIADGLERLHRLHFAPIAP